MPVRGAHENVRDESVHDVPPVEESVTVFPVRYATEPSAETDAILAVVPSERHLIVVV
jgi:hypothetical protein